MKIFEQEEWASAPGRWNGAWEGAPHGVPIRIGFHSTVGAGEGTDPRSDPGAEVFVIQRGRALFRIGADEAEARAGQVVVCPAGQLRQFTSLGPGLLEVISVLTLPRPVSAG